MPIVLVLSAEVLRYQFLSFLPPPQYNWGEIESNGFFLSFEQHKQNPIHLNQCGSRSFRIGYLKTVANKTQSDWLDTIRFKGAMCNKHSKNDPSCSADYEVEQF